MDLRPMLYVQAATNIFLDILIIGLPIPTLLKLTLPRRQKIGLIFVFTLGIL